MNHKTLEDRLDAAAMLIDLDPHTPVWVDTMTDACNKAYSARPERLVVILNDKVIYEGVKGPAGYNLDAVRTILTKICMS